MIRVPILLLLLISSIGVFSHAKDESPKVGDIAPDFTLQDVKEKEHTLKKLRGKIVFLIMGNRKIRKEDDKWAEAFQKVYKTDKRVITYIVADLRSVPGFIPKRFIRFQLKRNPPPAPFLLDWKGKVHQRYHTEKKKPNLYLISSKGELIYHKKANFTPELFTELRNQIDARLVNLPKK